MSFYWPKFFQQGGIGKVKSILVLVADMQGEDVFSRHEARLVEFGGRDANDFIGMRCVGIADDGGAV